MLRRNTACTVGVGLVAALLGGDLSLIARYWDRSSEKTIRKVITRA